jgi:hypothetical protein
MIVFIKSLFKWAMKVKWIPILSIFTRTRKSKWLRRLSAKAKGRHLFHRSNSSKRPCWLLLPDDARHNFVMEIKEI